MSSDRRKRLQRKARQLQYEQVQPTTPVDPGKYHIYPFPFDNPPPKAITWNREADRHQPLRKQTDGTLQALWDAGTVPRYSFAACCSLIKNPFPGPFRQAVQQARDLGLPLVTPTLSRILRSPLFHAYRNPEQGPEVADFEQLAEWLDGVAVYTLLPPTATLAQERHFLEKLAAGQGVSGP